MQLHRQGGQFPQLPTMELRKGDLGHSQPLVLGPFGTLDTPASSLDPYSSGLCEGGAVTSSLETSVVRCIISSLPKPTTALPIFF